MTLFLLGLLSGTAGGCVVLLLAQHFARGVPQGFGPGTIGGHPIPVGCRCWESTELCEMHRKRRRVSRV